MLKMRMFRPFPYEEVREILKGKSKAVVFDRNCSWGKGGIFADEIRGAIANLSDMPKLYSYVVGLGGRSITPDLIHEIVREAEQTEPSIELSVWKGMKS